MENGSCELHFLATLAQEIGVWKKPRHCTILSPMEPLIRIKVNFLEQRREKEKKNH